MANFCGKCGTPIDAATGFCPNCDRQKIKQAPPQKNFCVRCGGTIDKQTGTCPNCSAPKPQVTTASAPAAAKSKQKKKRSNAATVFITILLTICLLTTSSLALSIFNVRNALKENNVEKIFNNVEDFDLFESKIIDSSDLERFYERHLGDYDADIASEQIAEFLSESSMKEFVADKVSGFSDDFFNDGEAELTISKDEITELITENEDEISDTFDINLTYTKSQKIAEWIVGKDNDETTIFDSSDLKDEIPLLHTALRICLSYITMAILIIISIAIIALMMKNSYSQALSTIGVICIVSGAAAVLSIWIAPLLGTIFAGSFVGTVIGNIMSMNVFVNVVILIAGVAMLIIRNVIKKRLAK